MKAFLVIYEGLWLGGKAVVFAQSGEEALALVEAHPKTCMFQQASYAEASFTELDMSVPNVAYNDNGDY